MLTLQARVLCTYPASRVRQFRLYVGGRNVPAVSSFTYLAPHWKYLTYVLTHCTTGRRRCHTHTKCLTSCRVGILLPITVAVARAVCASRAPSVILRIIVFQAVRNGDAGQKTE